MWARGPDRFPSPLRRNIAGAKWWGSILRRPTWTLRTSGHRVIANQVQVGDAQQIEFPEASFDRSLALLVINFIPDARKAVREMRRVTKPEDGWPPASGTMTKA
jgi:SAM-dependent methyltransferase